MRSQSGGGETKKDVAYCSGWEVKDAVGTKEGLALNA